MKYSLYLDPVKTYTEALTVALIRNECCRWMTHNNKPLTVTPQLKFFRGLLQHNQKVSLLILTASCAHSHLVPCGYALIKTTENQKWLTAGIATQFRGKGFGRFVFQTLIERCLPWDIWLEVLRTNRRAIRLYKSLGFVTRKTTRKIYIMQYVPTA